MRRIIIVSIVASGLAASCKDKTSAPTSGTARPNLRAKPGNDLPAAMMSDLDPALAHGRVATAEGRRSLPTEVLAPADEPPVLMLEDVTSSPTRAAP